MASKTSQTGERKLENISQNSNAKVPGERKYLAVLWNDFNMVVAGLQIVFK